MIICNFNNDNNKSILLEYVLKVLCLALHLLHPRGLPVVDVTQLSAHAVDVDLALP